MPVPGIDYAWSHPDPAAIAAAGYRFACRYLSRDSTKNLTLPEAQTLAAHGIWVVANWEAAAQDALRGHDGGVADATTALAQAQDCGMPSGRPIYFSVDWDVTPAQEPAVTAYFDGVDSVLGPSRAGEYAGYYPMRVQRDGGVTIWEWQTAAWSGGQWDARVNIRQTGSATIAGVQVDTNEALTDDYGQWQPGTPPPGGNTMQWSDIIQGPNGRPNGNSVANILTDVGRLRDALTGDATALGPYGTGTPLAGLLVVAQQFPDLKGKLDALTVPSVTLDPASTAAALAAVPGFIDELAAGIVQHLLAAAVDAAAAAKSS